MSLLNAVLPILNTKTAKVVLEVSANPNVEGELVVIAKPLVGPVSDKAPNELKQLCAALATPLKAIGTPETIEAELYAVVGEQAAHRTGWANRAAELDALIAQAATKDSKPAKAAAKPAASKKAETPVEEPKDPLPIAGEPAAKPAEGAAESNQNEENLTLEL